MIPHWTKQNPVMNAAGFYLPLMSHFNLIQGVGSPTFTRATTATVFDQDGVMRTALAGEARFTGARRVYNPVPTNLALWNLNIASLTAGVSDPFGGNNAFTITATAPNQYCTWFRAAISGQQLRSSLWIRRRVGTGTILLYDGGPSNHYTDITSSVTSAWQRITVPIQTEGATNPVFGPQLATTGDSIDVIYGQLEVVTNQTNQNPAEYVSNGVLSAPYHGAGVDGVQYFEYLNGNTVSGNIVTAGVGAPIPNATLKGYLSEPAATNFFLNSGAPVTQTISLGVGTFTTWLTGTGSITTSAGTATATGYGTATSAAPNTITVTVAGTVVFTLAGTVTTAQVENNSYPTSYIATAGASVARNSDILNYQIAGNLSLTVGSLYSEVTLLSSGKSGGVSVGFASVNIQLNAFQNAAQFAIFDGTGTRILNTGPFTSGTQYKSATSWSGSATNGTVNGAAVTTSGFSGSLTSDTTLQIGSVTNALQGQNIRNVRIWQTQLPNSVLQQITT